MADFNPDAYLALKQPAPSFDPEAYLAEKGKPTPESAASAQSTMDFERGPDYPNSKMTDPSISDYMTVSGAAGLAKAAPGLVARGVGAALESIPAAKNIIPAIGEAADSMILKSLGTSPGQIKAMMGARGVEGGAQAVEDAAQVARKAGLNDVFSTSKGRREALANFIDEEGKKIGALRSEAGPASPDIYNKVAADVSQKYNPANADLLSGESPDIEKAINLAKHTANEVSPTNAGVAKGITAVNKYAAGPRANLPAGAITDVSKGLSRANDAEIAQSLGSDKAQQYLDALHNESGAFSLEPAQARGFQREMASRGGKGSIMSAIQKVADLGGYRATAKTLDSVTGALTNPEAVSDTVQPAIKTIGGVTANLMDRIQNNPQSLGKYAKPLMQAAQTSGNQGLAATHYILANTHPDYNEMLLKKEEDTNQ